MPYRESTGFHFYGTQQLRLQKRQRKNNDWERYVWMVMKKKIYIEGGLSGKMKSVFFTIYFS